MLPNPYQLVRRVFAPALLVALVAAVALSAAPLFARAPAQDAAPTATPCG